MKNSIIRSTKLELAEFEFDTMKPEKPGAGGGNSKSGIFPLLRMTDHSHPDLETRFAQLANQVLQDWPVDRWKNHLTLVAVSGGPDSVALLRLLHRLQAGQCHESGTSDPPNLIVAHYHHGTRGDESDQDEQFVRQLAQQLGLPLRVGRRSNDASRSDSEDDLRNARYQFLTEAAHQVGARYIATGHHREDQVETVLFRILRGTGISGLAGIPMFRRLDSDLVLARPLLKLARDDIHGWLDSIGQAYRTDSSNHCTDFSRNYLRREILPRIEEHFESKSRRVTRTACQTGRPN